VNHAPVVPVLLPALAAALMLLDRRIGAQRTLAWASTSLLAASAAWMVTLAADDWRGVYLLGNWAAPWGIVLVVDRLSALMLAITAVLALIALGAAHGRHDQRGEHFHPLFQVQLMGLSGAFLTGDLFNLFVFFEVLLIASYGLLVHGDGAARMAAGLRFVTLNLFGSSVFLLAAGMLYGVTGTLNYADLAQRVAPLTGGDATLVRIAAGLLLVVFTLKAAILPLCLWLPRTYSAATAPVAALFAVMTKVGIYALLRVFTLIFGASAGALTDMAFPWIVAPAAAGYALAMIGALAGGDLRRLAAALLVGSAAFLLIGIGLAGERSIASAVFYLPHTTLSAAALYLVADLVARSRGEAEDRLIAGPTPARPAALGLLFMTTGVAMGGLPPLGGFIGKAMLLDAMLPASGTPGLPPAVTAVLWFTLLGGSLLGVIAFARAGSALFWKPTSLAASGPDGSALPLRDLLPSLCALGLVLALTVFAAPLQRYAQATARDLLNATPLVDQVLRTVPRPGPHQPKPESLR
jgi:multicomponent K+:H+ antiporter subunit D